MLTFYWYDRHSLPFTFFSCRHSVSWSWRERVKRKVIWEFYAGPFFPTHTDTYDFTIYFSKKEENKKGNVESRTNEGDLTHGNISHFLCYCSHALLFKELDLDVHNKFRNRTRDPLQREEIGWESIVRLLSYEDFLRESRESCNIFAYFL
jgi:hypothetical protein